MQLIQQHVGPQERVAVSGTSIPLHAVIQRMLLSLWYAGKCWSNKIGSANKEVESYMRAVGQFGQRRISFGKIINLLVSFYFEPKNIPGPESMAFVSGGVG